ncbi:HNH endonuclease [Salmonella enterica subsp. enterica serovar Java]|nr:HNH endonuclease [Salmonella enterica subsp. enterica serovar Abony]EDW4641453.1 HNH endonuclease [Salmonella enterica subsp. enterica serovar Java]EGL1304167.1 HNH endonuclease [Salmonella enterica]EDA4887057.1 HNH endonuclease [Salmonella enterica subsp. enterica serovar Abony]EEO0128102.1 HNH endonuclease [Salmonella enterica subsp. enterica serovar Abony]
MNQEYLNECFRYHYGVLIWKYRPFIHFKSQRDYLSWNAKYADKQAGHIRPDGYYHVSVNGRKMLVHRIVWIMHNGSIPAGLEVDHIDRNRGNSTLSNLRLVTSTENNINQSLRSDNKSGAVGVCRHRNKWRAYIKLHGKEKHLGLFDSVAEAVIVRKAAEKESIEFIGVLK